MCKKIVKQSAQLSRPTCKNIEQFQTTYQNGEMLLGYEVSLLFMIEFCNITHSRQDMDISKKKEEFLKLCNYFNKFKFYYEDQFYYEDNISLITEVYYDFSLQKLKINLLFVSFNKTWRVCL